MDKGGERHGVTVSKDASGRIAVSFHYDPLLVLKVKTIPGHRWHPDKKYWSLPDSEETLKKIIKVFDHEEVHIDHALEAHVSTSGTVLPRTCWRRASTYGIYRNYWATPAARQRRYILMWAQGAWGIIRSPLDNLNIEGGDSDRT